MAVMALNRMSEVCNILYMKIVGDMGSWRVDLENRDKFMSPTVCFVYKYTNISILSLSSMRFQDIFSVSQG